MAELHVNLPSPEQTKSVELHLNLEQAFMDGETVIYDAFKNKNNSLHILVGSNGEGRIGFKAGDNYPNAMLGDLWLPCPAGLNDYIIEDISRFENRDGSIRIANSPEINGSMITAVAKRAGLQPVDNNPQPPEPPQPSSEEPGSSEETTSEETTSEEPTQPTVPASSEG